MSLAMLEGQEKFSLQDVQRLKFNTRMLLADRVKPDLLRAARQAANPSPDLKRGLELLEAWNGHVAKDSKGAVLFQRFWDTYSAAVQQPYAVAWDPKNPAKTPSGLADPPSAVKHLEQAVAWTRQTYGSESVAWGEVHRVRVGDVDVPADGAGGEYGLFHVVSFAPAPDGKRVANSGDGWILTVEFSKPITAYSVLAYGETSNPASKHHSDQARLFANHQFKRVWFTEAEIRAHLERAYHPGE
ncbi:MAG: penicillin acylase family protein [Acidobacteria bacterium]|nr:penicillin acylase family protein [Acidobacteriota bacterium]